MDQNKQKRLFIVEDELVYATTVKIMLENMGYSVEIFPSGENMISAWEEDPDAIILDYDLGAAMNGAQILRFIRRISKSLPVIMLTGNKDISNATQLLKTGAIDFIVKDDNISEHLEKTLSQVFESIRLREEMNRNKIQVKKYRERLLIIVLVVALAVMTLLWLIS